MVQETTDYLVAENIEVNQTNDEVRANEDPRSTQDPGYFRVAMHILAKDPSQREKQVKQSWLCVPSFPSYHGAQQYVQEKQSDCAKHSRIGQECYFEILPPFQPFHGERSLLIRPVELVYTQDHRVQLWLNLFVCTDTDQVAWCEDIDSVSYAAAQIPWPGLPEQDWIWRIVCSYPSEMTRNQFAMLGRQ